MKFRLPPDCRGVTHAGTTLAIAVDGTIDADPTAAAALATHGLVGIDETVAAAPPLRGKARQDKKP